MTSETIDFPDARYRLENWAGGWRFGRYERGIGNEFGRHTIWEWSKPYDNYHMATECMRAHAEGARTATRVRP